MDITRLMERSGDGVTNDQLYAHACWQQREHAGELRPDGHVYAELAEPDELLTGAVVGCAPPGAEVTAGSKVARWNERRVEKSVWPPYQETIGTVARFERGLLVERARAVSA